MARIDDLKERYEAFSQGDLDKALDLWSDDFTWQGANSTELPGGGEHQGKDEAKQVLQQAVGAYDTFELHADEFLENGDTVVVLGHTNVKKGDSQAEIPVVHVWRYEGDEVKRLQILTDTLQSAEILGIK